MIAVIGAMQIEVDAILKKVDTYEEKNSAGLVYYLSKINNTEVIISLSGVGKVNASMSVTSLLNKFNVDLVINIGTAGGLLEKENTLDLVIADKTIQYDFDTTILDGEKGKGIISTCDEHYAKKAMELLRSDDYHIYYGDLACGDKFVSETNQLEKIVDDFNSAIACDMESGAICQVCNKMNVKCIIIRSLSDIVHKDNSHIDFKSYALKASQRSADFVYQFIKEFK